MTDTSLDYSQKPDLQPLADVVRSLQSIAAPAGIEVLLIGAMARDLWLRHGFGIAIGRQTEDVDFAVMIRDWESFASLRAALIDSRDFTSRGGPATHRLRHRDGLPLDIVPFGGIERADRTIAWPPDQATVFNCFGAREAFAASVLVKLPNDIYVSVASIPALMILKTVAWNDRKYTHAGKDASDIALFLRNYMDCNDLETTITDHPDLFGSPGSDYETAGARLLGRDVAKLLDAGAAERLLKILLPEADPEGTMLLAGQSGVELERMRQLIEAVCDELSDALIPRDPKS